MHLRSAFDDEAAELRRREYLLNAVDVFVVAVSNRPEVAQQSRDLAFRYFDEMVSALQAAGRKPFPVVLVQLCSDLATPAGATPTIDAIARRLNAQATVSCSAKTGAGVDAFWRTVAEVGARFKQ